MLALATLGRFQVSFVVLGIATALFLLVWGGVLSQSSSLEPNQKIGWSLGIAVASFFICWGATYLVVLRNRSSYLEKAGIKDKLKEYVESGKHQARGAEAMLIGRVVVVEKDHKEDWEFDAMQFKLDRKLIPKKPEDVGTVVLVSWSQSNVGSYTNGATANKWHAQAELIDYKSQVAFARRSFSGGEPPSSTKSTGTVTGSKPYSEIVKWLNGLPRKPLGTTVPPPRTRPGGGGVNNPLKDRTRPGGPLRDRFKDRFPGKDRQPRRDRFPGG